MSKIDDLTEAVAILAGRVAALEARQPPAPRAAPMPAPAAGDEGVRIFAGQDLVDAGYARGNSFAMPSDIELQRLQAVVHTAYPMLRPDLSPPQWADRNAREDLEAFKTAFCRLAEINRVDQLDTKRSTISWIQEAEDWLRVRGRGGHITAQAFVAALVAHGDIKFTAPDAFPYELNFGLDLYHGRPGRDAWRKVLSSGWSPMPTVISKTSAPASPSTVRLVG